MYLPVEPGDLDGEHYFQRFDLNIALREVILGPLCDVSVERVRVLSTVFEPGIAITKARLAFKTFRVVADRRFEP